MHDYKDDAPEVPVKVEMANYNSNTPLTAGDKASVQRPSHIWSSSKRNFIEDPEFEKLKASMAKPGEVQ